MGLIQLISRILGATPEAIYAFNFSILCFDIAMYTAPGRYVKLSTSR